MEQKAAVVVSPYIQWVAQVTTIDSFPLAAVLKNQEGFQQFLVRNLSLSNSTASTLLNSSVNLQELHAEQAGPVAPLSQSQLGALLKDLADVERLLKDVDLLSGLARLLPKGACAGQNPVSTSNGTWPLNTTTWSINTTDVPREDGEEGAEGGGKKEGEENPHSQFSAFVQLWAGLQPILCGNNRIIEPEALKQGNMSSLGFTSKEQRNLGLLVHLMTTNPKILYSPIGSQVDKVIQKANETFAFVGNVTHYTRVWLNISAQLRTFLEEGRLQSHLLWLQQVHSAAKLYRNVFTC
ncbi:ATP-binding cassette sub-family A member 2-like [Poecilia formosa]|uniref:ATP-binding cassette sub-family A member 2-like n=1 Tax=Poecilia formosa TaxID=48698 RepID=UPI0007B98851|nr:PREDICTED: ATP-binding cassette sub-family A member 2-like [Poecilia formosa]